MKSPTAKPNLETRAFALGLWPERSDGETEGVDETRLSPGRRRHVAVMLDAGWLDRVDGKLLLNEVGRQAVVDLMPETPPKLTDAQNDLLIDVLEGRTGGSDLSYAPAVKLLAYGYVTALAKRFGGIKLEPTERARAWYAISAEAPSADEAPAPAPPAP